MEEIRLKLSYLGQDLWTRFPARTLREKIEEKFSTIDRIVLDLTGVDSVSESFADELIGKLVFKFYSYNVRDKLFFENADEAKRSIFWRALIFRAREKLGQVAEES